MLNKFPSILQKDLKNCGPTCIQIISKFYKRNIPSRFIQKEAGTNRVGTTLLGLSEASEKLGYRTLVVSINLRTLKNDGIFPCIIHWNNSHFVVVYKITKKNIYVSDPSFGLIKYSHRDFIDGWISNNADEVHGEGIVLFIEPSPSFFKQDVGFEEYYEKKIFSLNKVLIYIYPYKTWILQIIIGLCVGSLFSLIFPFTTQFLVDSGIKDANISLIYILLLSQLMLFLGNSFIEIIRSWLILHLNTRIRISMISDFFIKLMSLPISYFDNRMTGDILQKLNDHKSIENLITTGTLNTIFSLFTIILFGVVILIYDLRIFFIYLLGSVFYISWILFFLKRRKILNYKNYSRLSLENSKVIEIISGMPEIKSNNAEIVKRWEWEHVQIKLFKINIEKLKIEQIQTVGSKLINQLKDIIITFYSAKLVLDNSISFGMMLSIQYIIGQLNNPLLQLVNFIQQLQDANISISRLNELHNIPSEKTNDSFNNDVIINNDIIINNLSFKYPGNANYTLSNLNFTIPYNKKVAIVGASGSGKSTLIKILMKYYDNYEGNINISNFELRDIAPKSWRNISGIVMQDSFIFNDTIANNIALNNNEYDYDKLIKASEVGNSIEFIKDLPKKFNTIIGQDGIGLSGGQKQRIMISRAVYKNPHILFLDEATSSLDSKNENEINKNLNIFLENKTAIVIAHRLSTVKDANLILVLDEGKLIESGTDESLLKNKSKYYELIKNQLELDLFNGE